MEGVLAGGGGRSRNGGVLLFVMLEVGVAPSEGPTAAGDLADIWALAGTVSQLRPIGLFPTGGSLLDATMSGQG